MDDSHMFPMGYSDGDVDTNLSGNTPFASIVSERYSRRQTMFGGVAALTTAVLSTSLLAACDDDKEGGSPNVDAGQDAQTNSGRVVALTGTTGGDPDSAGWEQVSGPEVVLTNADTATASFIAPSVADSTPLVFRFTATDARGRESSDESTVTVSPARLGFEAVAKSLDDKVIVPEGYSVTVLYRLGDPIKAGVSAYSNNGSDSDFDGRAGDHHDALYYYGLSTSGNGRDDNNSNRGLLVMNHENITQDFLHPSGPSPAPRPEAEALKEMEAHGVSVVEVNRDAAGGWTYAQGSALNRRVTPLIEVDINGPAGGSPNMRTRFSPDGTAGRGTINNCANGFTPWGTNITCEENWAYYFRRDYGDDAARTPAQATALSRYGVSEGNGGNFAWTTVQPADPDNTVFSRWNATVDPGAADATEDFRNEPNQFGWVVEIDPYDPSKAPRKRTALGRFGHEGCWPGLFTAGRRPAFYMGDDGRGEYIYKFVSSTPWTESDAQSDDRLAIGDKYLDEGTLYVARFSADGTGVWLPLVFGQGPLAPGNADYSFQDQADVLIHARLAADALGATPMDRPEWSAANPVNGEIYFTLTNSNASKRPLNGTDAPNPRHYNDLKEGDDQFGNPNGHILRMKEAGDSGEASGFEWDIYAFGAGADLDPNNVNISMLDAMNDFSSPDGLWFSRPSNPAGLVNPVLWIQTDDGAYTDVTNCMMLAAMPGQVGDGGPVTITNVGAGGAMASQATNVGQAPGTNMRRFLVGPKECEITGIDSTPDGRALFVNIQHPGEDGNSNWPASQSDNSASSRPRSATIVITKDDGGIVAL
ncbi:alkaline phosphatase PhoX [Allosphingosinicella sp.]|uniref:PhoX family protein n=1 Tax=Allosphingosinicella sp. TaxID=2823234 RepID=UPI002FC20181